MSFHLHGALDPDSPLFVGREEELFQIERWLRRGDAVGAVLGGRQNGKTSVLLRARERARTWQPIAFVDFQAVAGADPAACARHLAEQVADQLGGALMNVPPLPGGAVGLQPFLRAVASAAQPPRIGLFLDELGVLPEETRRWLGSALRASFNYRLVHRELWRWTFVLAGGIELCDMAVHRNSPLRNVLDEIYLGDLSETAVTALLAAAAVPGLPASRAAELCAVTAGQPYLTQALAEEAARAGSLAAGAAALLRTETHNLPHVFHAIGREGLEPLFRQIVAGQPVPFTRLDDDVARLELIGVIRDESGLCQPRNTLYATAARRRYGISAPEPARGPQRRFQAGQALLAGVSAYIAREGFDDLSAAERDARALQSEHSIVNALAPERTAPAYERPGSVVHSGAAVEASMTFPRSLVEALRHKHLVPFVGAGVAMAVRRASDGKSLFPSWPALLAAAAVRLTEEGRHNDAALVNAFLSYDTPRLLEAAHEAKRALGPIWNRFLVEQLNPDAKDVQPSSLELARLVWGLGSQLVITTNYDAVLRWACPDRLNLREWIIETPSGLVELLRGPLQRPTVWHLHGTIHHVDDIILTPDGYTTLYPSSPTVEVRYKAALESLRTQMAGRTLLFVGFSLEDRLFGDQLRWVSEAFRGAVGPHFALVRSEDRRAFEQRAAELPVEIIEFEAFGEPLHSRLRALAMAAAPGGGMDHQKLPPGVPAASEPLLAIPNDLESSEDLRRATLTAIDELKATRLDGQKIDANVFWTALPLALQAVLRVRREANPSREVWSKVAIEVLRATLYALIGPELMPTDTLFDRKNAWILMCYRKEQRPGPSFGLMMKVVASSEGNLHDEAEKGLLQLDGQVVCGGAASGILTLLDVDKSATDEPRTELYGQHGSPVMIV
ncbi:SIR2 family protein [Sorangium sp. So ce1389]|uniref:SIR2 family protein n=1 Tax=Sorangium sp. So ce1389 TaxID=3133336 RepID=UPI003F639FC9